MWTIYRYRKIILSLVFLTIIAGSIGYYYWRGLHDIDQFIYDRTHQNESVQSIEEMNRILDSYPTVAYRDMEKEYLDYTLSNTAKYKPMLARSEYILIPRKDMYRKIVGEFRIRHFMCRDKYYKESQYEEIYWLVNRKLLFKTLELIETLQAKGYNPYGFYIRNGHRHPMYNEKIKGASKSRHIKGEAVDIVIQDINLDGKSNQDDKTIVYDLLNKEIIGDTGGIGKYPGTMSIHYDVRGKRARWDSY